MLKKIGSNLARDLWIVILDIVAVNAAYYLALILRFYVNSEFRPSVSYYLTYWLQFTPYYTVLAILVFILFRLYGGMWRYAGINDMNRILGANAVTCVIQVAGTLLFVGRMPITYYGIGAVLQFTFLVMIRFGYRMILEEKRKIESRKSPKIPALVIGARETARRTIRHLEEHTPFRAVTAISEKSAGKSLDGVPVEADWKHAAEKVQAIFIADPDLSEEQRKEIQEFAETRKMELQDYTGYLSNLGGRVSLTALLELTQGPVMIRIGEEEKQYTSGKEALSALTDRYDIAKIEGAKIELRKPSEAAYAGYEAWAKQHKEETGEDVSFF